MADGIPLFIEELTRAVVDSALDAARSRARSAAPLPLDGDSRHPADSLMARLDQLGSAKLVAQQAGVIGREFSYELLRRDLTPAPQDACGRTDASRSRAGPRRPARARYSTSSTRLCRTSPTRAPAQPAPGTPHVDRRSHGEAVPTEEAGTARVTGAPLDPAVGNELALAGWLAAGERASSAPIPRGDRPLADRPRSVPHLSDPGSVAREGAGAPPGLGTGLMIMKGRGARSEGALPRALALVRGKPESDSLRRPLGLMACRDGPRTGRERADELLRSPRNWATRRSCCRPTTVSGRRSTCSARTTSVAGTPTRARALRPGPPRLQARSTAGTTPGCARWASAHSCWLLGRLREGLGTCVARWMGGVLGHVGSRAHAMDYALAVHRLRRDAARSRAVARRWWASPPSSIWASTVPRAMLFRGWATSDAGDAAGGSTRCATR